MYIAFGAVKSCLHCGKYLVICIVSLTGMLTCRSFMSSVINWYLSLVLIFISVCANDIMFGVKHVLGILIHSSSVFQRNIASL